MENVTEKEVAPALQLLQLFLTSPRFIGLFTAIRILQNFATRHPQLINPLNPDIEALISDTNRSIATYAITTLLKTGNEASVDRLMKEITGFIGRITDEFKVTIVEASGGDCITQSPLPPELLFDWPQAIEFQFRIIVDGTVFQTLITNFEAQFTSL
jgi:coatomer protein complex subunit gamma